MTGSVLLQQLINGVSLGSLYALIAIGYTMVYGVLRLINFAHGDFLMVAAYLGLFGLSLFSLPWPLAFGLALILTGLMGAMLERGAYRPLRRAPRLSLLISAIGVSFLLENLVLVFIGGRPLSFPTPAFFGGAWRFGELYLPRLSVYIPLITLIVLAGLFVLIYSTRVGMALRALAFDWETTQIMGVNVNRLISLTFILGSTLAGVGGLLWAMKYPQVNPFLGILPGLKAFVAAVLGGIGSLPGAVVGGVLLGLLEITVVAVFPSWAGYRDALAFGLLIVVLLVRPTGIMGEIMLAEKL
ncbi:branched-chain amino acid ABC transporter permease [Desulfobacca acetoxidans]|uniref:ABC-type transporter, integral membrane subunit n=1 Tax=Desulfobacca acetoxidans (strain ATCC 700848 / DSM 11109 / ASRB2) TaxID=880072 RepID=F2NCH3_DESAR|nr:branched-chain amino acid ABC transporter permease [Desulfobacca acetoxidans]AEB09107.1 ABC-type transporter, integral membrane subunit [Desulfobacca acetoxidans DSM 11109]HAY23082.1 branched-chain amino acid ABC transporter permease [Desulfobacterales bacterium]